MKIIRIIFYSFLALIAVRVIIFSYLPKHLEEQEMMEGHRSAMEQRELHKNHWQELGQELRESEEREDQLRTDIRDTAAAIPALVEEQKKFLIEATDAAVNGEIAEVIRERDRNPEDWFQRKSGEPARAQQARLERYLTLHAEYFKKLPAYMKYHMSQSSAEVLQNVLEQAYAEVFELCNELETQHGSNECRRIYIGNMNQSRIRSSDFASPHPKPALVADAAEAFTARFSISPEALNGLLQREVNRKLSLTISEPAWNEMLEDDVLLAAGQTKTAALETLVDKGVEVNLLDEHGTSPLCRAIASYSVDNIKLLLGRGADVRIESKGGTPPLACLFRSFALEGEPKLRLITMDKILHKHALYPGEHAYFERLAATVRKQREIIDLLVLYRADVNAVDAHNKSVLFYALEKGAFDSVKQLITAGARLNGTAGKGFEGKTPLIVAVKEVRAGDRLELLEQVQYLLRLGADVNETGAEGETALFYAEHPAVVRLLLEYGAKINVISARGITPLSRAATIGDQAFTAIIEHPELDPAFPGYNSGLLVELVRDRHYDLAQMLVEAGVGINQQDSYGRTALMWAAMNGSPETLKYLLAQGADSTLKSKSRDTAFTLARSKGFIEIAEILHQHETNPGQAADIDTDSE